MSPTSVGACTSSSSALVAAGACTLRHPAQPARSSADSIASIRSGAIRMLRAETPAGHARGTSRDGNTAPHSQHTSPSHHASRRSHTAHHTIVSTATAGVRITAAVNYPAAERAAASSSPTCLFVWCRASSRQAAYTVPGDPWPDGQAATPPACRRRAGSPDTPGAAGACEWCLSPRRETRARTPRLPARATDVGSGAGLGRRVNPLDVVREHSPGAKGGREGADRGADAVKPGARQPVLIAVIEGGQDLLFE